MSPIRRTAYFSVYWLCGCVAFCGYSALLAQNGGRNAGPSPDEMFKQLDANQDGKLTLDEQKNAGGREFMQKLLQMAKLPATGSVDRAEFNRLAEEHRNATQGQGQGGGRGPGPGNGPSGPGGGRGPGGEPGFGPGNGPGGPGGGRGPGGPGGSGGPREDGPPRGLPPVLRGLDENNDQRLSKAELSRLAERFDALDTNHDGQLDIAELGAIDRGRGPGGPGPGPGGGPGGPGGGRGPGGPVDGFGPPNDGRQGPPEGNPEARNGQDRGNGKAKAGNRSGGSSSKRGATGKSAAGKNAPATGDN